jgi:hypothetical protein
VLFLRYRAVTTRINLPRKMFEEDALVNRA